MRWPSNSGSAISESVAAISTALTGRFKGRHETRCYQKSLDPSAGRSGSALPAPVPTSCIGPAQSTFDPTAGSAADSYDPTSTSLADPVGAPPHILGSTQKSHYQSKAPHDTPAGPGLGRCHPSRKDRSEHRRRTLSSRSPPAQPEPMKPGVESDVRAYYCNGTYWTGKRH